MIYRKLGKTGLEVSALGFGGWGIGGWEGAEDSESIRSIELAMDLGVTLFDSALGYGNGHSESLIGQVVNSKADRDRYIVTSKIPPKNYVFPAQPGTPAAEAYPKDWIIECTEKSLVNYGLDYIDIQHFHVWTNEWDQDNEWKEAVEQLKKDGKIRLFGPSINFPYSAQDDGIALMNGGQVDIMQVVHNIYQQEPEKDIFPAAERSGVGIIARCPLDEGSLSGKMTPDTVLPEGSFLETYFKEDRKKIAFEKAQAMNWLMDEGFAESLAEAALRYSISFPAVSSTIAGMRNPKHAQANCNAIEKGPLSEEVLQRLKEHAFDHNWWI